jgi:hypothetical protein
MYVVQVYYEARLLELGTYQERTERKTNDCDVMCWVHLVEIGTLYF